MYVYIFTKQVMQKAIADHPPTAQPDPSRGSALANSSQFDSFFTWCCMVEYPIGEFRLAVLVLFPLANPSCKLLSATVSPYLWLGCLMQPCEGWLHCASYTWSYEVFCCSTAAPSLLKLLLKEPKPQKENKRIDCMFSSLFCSWHLSTTAVCGRMLEEKKSVLHKCSEFRSKAVPTVLLPGQCTCSVLHSRL